MYEGPGKPGLHVTILHWLKLAHTIRGLLSPLFLYYPFNPCLNTKNNHPALICWSQILILSGRLLLACILRIFGWAKNGTSVHTNQILKQLYNRYFFQITIIKFSQGEKKYQFYYPHRLRDTVSPICEIFCKRVYID